MVPHSLSNDGMKFSPEQTLFGGAYPDDQFPVTPAPVTKGDQVLGVLYGANGVDLLSGTDAIFARCFSRE
jgi:hypothetical protein